MKQYISEEFFTFFKKLAANNHKEWFDANKKWYEESVKKPFEQLVDALIVEMATRNKAYQGLQSKDCIFRINRDVRFAKDKSPYKLNRSALITPDGKKGMHSAGFYFEMGPDQCGLYAGSYMMEKEALAATRNYIAKNNAKFEAIISDKAFKKTFGEVQGEKQKRLDASLKEAGEKQPLLYNTQFYVAHEFSEKKACAKDIVDYLLSVSETADPFVSFIDKAQRAVSSK